MERLHTARQADDIITLSHVIKKKHPFVILYFHLTPIRNNNSSIADYINIKILNAGAWARSSERIPVSLPRELEDYIPEVEEFYKRNHSGRKLQWHHLMSNGVVAFENTVGKYDLGT